MNKFAKYVPEEDKKKQREHIGAIGASELPFGEELVTVYSATMSADVDLGGGVYSVSFNEPPFIPIVGKKYLVEWDGVPHELIAKSFMDGGYIVIGNPKLTNFEEDTGEPFAFAVVPAYGNACGINTTEAGEHTIIIKTEDIKTIDPKYLPNPTVFVTVDTDFDTMEMTASHSYDEVKELVMKGINVTLVIDVSPEGMVVKQFASVQAAMFTGDATTEYILFSPTVSILNETTAQLGTITYKPDIEEGRGIFTSQSFRPAPMEL